MDRVERDAFVDQALAIAGIPIVRFPVRSGYALNYVRGMLAEILSPSENTIMAAKAKEEQDAVQPEIVVSVQQTPVQTELAKPVSPKCSSEMVKRKAAKGEHAGKWFWACSAFPKCRQVEAIGDG
jgi:hypothetical protein